MASIQVLVFFLILTFSLYGLCTAEEQGKGRSSEMKIRFEDLDLSITENAGQDILGGGYTLNFSRRGKMVYTGECAFRVHNPQILSGIPGPNCRSLLTYCFSGGAHCCMSLIIATACGSQRSLDLIDLAHSGSEVKFIDIGAAGTKALKVTDWQFAYYGVEGTDFQLSFADSPGMTRLLVFDGGKWRSDASGEFSRFYGTLFTEARQSALTASRKREGTELAAGRAIKAAYYFLMSGKPADGVADELKQLLPSSWKPEADKISADIRHAIREFNPVEVIE